MAEHSCGAASAGPEDTSSVEQLPTSHDVSAGGQAALTAPRKRRVSYFYQGDVGHYYYGPGHPMKPHRLKLTHHLLLSYGLYKHLTVYRPHLATAQEMTQFHSPEYVDFLRRVSPDNARDFGQALQEFQLGEYTDCPVFDGLYDFCRIYSGASIDGALRLNQQQTDVAINWSGGLHHAKKSEASGFCYINDIVLAILELLKHHPRVLYIDIDIHHGDGVEEAFYTTDRVMTCSFHKYGDFFPGTGDVRDVGHGPGKGYSVNFPLQEGITDEAYQSVFKPVIAKIMETYKPTAVVLQCGADSLTGDRLGSFNLSLKGHAQCVSFVQSFALPTLVLGGGGYTIRNVARCWAFETSVLLGRELPDAIPPNDYIEFYRPSYKLHLTPSADVTNLNSPSYLHRHLTEILQNLKAIDGAPSVQFQDVPPDWAVLDEDDDTRKLNPDARPLLIDSGPQHEAELYDDDTDQDREQPAVQPAADDDGDVQLSSAPSAAAPPSPPKAGSASAPQQPPTAVVSQAATLTTATSTDSAQAASAEQGAASANGQAMPPAVSAEPEAALPSDSTATAEAKQSVDPEQTGKVAADAAATE